MKLYEIIGNLVSEEKNAPETKKIREHEGEAEDFEESFVPHFMRHSSSQAAIIERKATRFNKRLGKKGCYFVSQIKHEEILLGVIDNGIDDVDNELEKFLKTIGITMKVTSKTETTFSDLEDMLDLSYRCDFITDREEVMKQFGLEDLFGFPMHRITHEEAILTEYSKENTYGKAGENTMEKTLVPELNRIYQGKAKQGAQGHPVHYLLQSSNREMRQEACNVLLSALYENGRISNKRYWTVDIAEDEEYPKQAIETMYACSAGGAIIIRFRNDIAENNNYLSIDREAIEIISECASKYRHSVLTIFLFPRCCARSKEALLSSTEYMTIMEITEVPLSMELCHLYLNNCAKKWGIRTDKKLWEKLDNKKTYFSSDLDTIFECWHSEKIKNVVYPQYGEFATSKKNTFLERPQGSAYNDLMELIGLEEPKKVINQLLDYVKAQNLYAKFGINDARPAMHMAFLGASGTAKTTVARLFADILKDNGLLSSSAVVETGRADLVSKYVGGTAPKIRDLFKQAAGGVLFIDEAYSLVDDRDGSFGDEAINTIVQEMENHRDDIVVIFAGYPDKMEAFLQKNPGLRSRIGFHVTFNDYSTAELCEIGKLIAAKNNLTITESALAKLAFIFDKAKKYKDFGNGRFVRNVIEKAKITHASRLVNMDQELLNKEDVFTLDAEDIEIPATEKKRQADIGFLCA